MTFNFISLIPNLVDIQGHQFAYHEAIQKQLDLPFKAYLSKKHRIDPLPKGWIPFFSNKDNRKFSFYATLKRTYEFCKLFRKKEANPRAFFLESFNRSDLLAIFLATKLFLKKQDSLLLLFRYDLNTTQVTIAKRINAILLSDSELIVEQFARYGLKAYLLPIPHAEITKVRTTSNEEILCWWPGEPRPEKGEKEIRALLKREDFKLIVSEKFKTDKPCEKVPAVLTRKHYLKCLTTIDLVLLPYDPITYRSSTSGIFVETIVAGKLPLVKEGSWLSHELKKFDLHELIVDWNRPDFFSVAKQLLNDPATREKLKKMQAAYTVFHSPKSFCQKLLKPLIAT